MMNFDDGDKITMSIRYNDTIVDQLHRLSIFDEKVFFSNKQETFSSVVFNKKEIKKLMSSESIQNNSVVFFFSFTEKKKFFFVCYSWMKLKHTNTHAHLETIFFKS